MGLVAPKEPGKWTVPSDLVEQLERRQQGAPARYRLSLETMPLSLDAQARHQGPVWLDTLDVARLAKNGFGAELRAAMERRGQVLRELGIAPDDPERGAKISNLPQRAVGREIARQSGERFLESAPPGFRGELRRGPEGSPYLVVSDGARFVLVDDSPGARLRMGLDVQVVRDISGRPALAHELALRRQLEAQERGLLVRPRDRGPDLGR
jgi:hypothetical protein